jgi:protocatechuate 3,4-dioxygenase beta subunit
LGPYYKPGAPERSDIVDGQPGQALVVSGTVYGCDCVTPLAGAVVDVWQANDAGEYDNTGYVLRGKMTTDAEGHYEIATILPGFYLNGASYRPRHIHYKVSHLDDVALTTQLYFEGDPNIPTDAFVKPSLVMPLSEEPDGAGGTRFRCVFDIVLA